MTQTVDTPTLAPERSVEARKLEPNEGAKRRLANLSRPAKGEVNEGLRRYQEARKAGQLPPQWTRKTLAECINRVLRQRNGKKMEELAESIVEKAIEGNAACLAVIVDRFAPLETGQGQGRTVFEGIKLEVVGSSDGQRTTIALVRGSESHRESAAQTADDPTGAEAPRAIEGVKLDSQESQESQA